MNDDASVTDTEAVHELLVALDDLGVPHDPATAAGLLTRLEPQSLNAEGIETLATEIAFSLAREHPGGYASPAVFLDRELLQDTLDCLLVAAQTRIVAGTGLSVAYSAIDAFIELDLAKSASNETLVSAPSAVCWRAARILSATAELQKSDVLPRPIGHVFDAETPLWFRLPDTALRLATECATSTT